VIVTAFSTGSAQHPSTIDGWLAATAAARPDADALIFPGERATWAELESASREVARGLIGLGIEAGDRVGVLMPNSPECVASILGILMAGGVVVPINIRYRAAELPHVVGDGDLVCILTSDRIADYLDLPQLLLDAIPGLTEAGTQAPLSPPDTQAPLPRPAALSLPAAPALRSVVVFGSARVPGMLDDDAFRALAASVSPAAVDQRRTAPGRSSTAIVLYTSGTTASPRGCLLDHSALLDNWAAVAEVLGVRADDRFWAPCPLFHLAAIGPLTACLQTGAAFVSDVFFDPARALELIAGERATILYPAYPPLTQGLIAAPGFAEADLSAGRVILNVAPPDVLRQLQTHFPDATQVSLYGLTEAAGAVTYTRTTDSLDERTSTCGPALPGMEVRIIDPETGEPLAVDEPGEIAIRGQGLFSGYHKDPERKAALSTPDGWFRTGDQGALDQDGNLRFLGRLKEMLKVGGENVAPAEVEELVALHPAVKLVQVVGIPDDRLEEVPVAAVELRPGMGVTEDELIAFCSGRIASFKVPRRIFFRTDWPMSATKIQKGPLREQLLREL
jgi:fatty-acyl-CoA synthase